MLYDNALLARAYLHAWQMTGDASFRRVVEETLDFVLRELTHPEGGFYSSLDADSEGEEGKFYVWTRDEIKEQFESDSEFFETAYGITDRGNWEGKTVLQRAVDDASLAARFKLDPAAVTSKLAGCHAKLLSARTGRIRPGTDNKVLTAWNGLMLAAFAEAARVLGVQDVHRRDAYLDAAARNADFILSRLRPDGKLRRSWRDGKTTEEVFLEDYAALILGLLELYQSDFKNKWFSAAIQLADEMIERFSDPVGGFFDTPSDAKSLLVRPKDVQDNATPSGNALAVEALLKLSMLSERGDFRDKAEESLRLVTGFAAQYPTGFARWLGAAQIAIGKVKQVALVFGRDEEYAQAMVETTFGRYRPNMVVAGSRFPVQDDAPSLLKDRPLLASQKSAAYVCEGFVCLQPAGSTEDLARQLDS